MTVARRPRRVSTDGTIVVWAPEKSSMPEQAPWVVIWVESGVRNHWPYQALRDQEVGTWSALQAANEKTERVS